MEEKKITVGEQQGILVKPGIKHYIANEEMEQLDFLVISQPSTNGDRITIEA